jgi:hypothetical protein
VVKKIYLPVTLVIYYTVLDSSSLDVSVTVLSRQAKSIETECYGVVVCVVAIFVAGAPVATATTVPF